MPFYHDMALKKQGPDEVARERVLALRGIANSRGGRVRIPILGPMSSLWYPAQWLEIAKLVTRVDSEMGEHGLIALTYEINDLGRAVLSCPWVLTRIETERSEKRREYPYPRRAIPMPK